MKIIHYSSEVIHCLEKRDYPQSDLSWQAKPNGLWISIEDLPESKNNYNWKEWCEAEKFCIETLKHAHEIILKEDANILHLKTPKEIIELGDKFPLNIRGFDRDTDHYELNWEEVKKLYQGIIIAPYQWDCRLSLECSWYYGWDCSSGCLWDLKCIESMYYLTPNSPLKGQVDLKNIYEGL